MSTFAPERVDTPQPAGAKLLSRPILFPDEFKTWLTDYVGTNIPMLPFSQLFGARINVARSGDYIPTSEAGSSATSYVDLATIGPQLTNLADGSYLVMYGVSGRDRTSISVNGSTPSDDDSLYGQEAGPQSSRQKIVSLKNNNQNTIKLQYKGTRNFSKRWLTVVRLGAP